MRSVNVTSLDVDPQDRAAAVAALVGVRNGVANVGRRAANRTVVTVRAQASRAVAKILNLKVSAIKGTMTIRRANFKNPAASVTCWHAPTPIVLFGARPTNAGIRVCVKKAEGWKFIPHAFFADMPVRVKGGGISMQRSSLGVFDRAKKGGFSKARVHRLPIHEVFSSSVADVLGDEPVIKPIQIDALELFHKNFMRELDFEMSKIGAK